MNSENNEYSQIHKEKQYDFCQEVKNSHGVTKLGLMSNQSWFSDPKRLTFLFSRYKFVAKMLSNCESAVEIGCADAFASRIVRQEVKELLITDFDPIFIEDVDSRMDDTWDMKSKVHDILKKPVAYGTFDAAYSMDVIEHIQPSDEDTFLSNIAKSVNKHGIVIIGTPSLESQAYASEISKAGHVNCKSAPEWNALFRKHFDNVFSFGMNDEVLHTGYHKMCQYLLFVCTSKK